jgi:hypothetical protein
MKFLSKFIALGILSGAIFSCEQPDIEPISTGNDVSARVNNVSFESTEVDANLFVSNTDTTLEINATGGDNSIIKLHIDDIKLQTYTISNQNLTAKYLKSTAGGQTTNQDGTSGSFTLTSFDLSSKKVSGNFTFNTPESTITDGQIKNLTFIQVGAL